MIRVRALKLGGFSGFFPLRNLELWLSQKSGIYSLSHWIIFGYCLYLVHIIRGQNRWWVVQSTALSLLMESLTLASLLKGCVNFKWSSCADFNSSWLACNILHLAFRRLFKNFCTCTKGLCCWTRKSMNAWIKTFWSDQPTYIMIPIDTECITGRSLRRPGQRSVHLKEGRRAVTRYLFLVPIAVEAVRVLSLLRLPFAAPSISQTESQPWVMGTALIWTALMGERLSFVQRIYRARN